MTTGIIRKVAAAGVAAALSVSLGACAKGGSSTTNQGTSANGTTELAMWTHNAGNEEELGAITSIVDDFNASVESADRAHMVRALHGTAMIAGRHRRLLNDPMSAALVTARG